MSPGDALSRVISCGATLREPVRLDDFPLLPPMNPTNPFHYRLPPGDVLVTDAAERIKMVRAFSREQCLAASRMGGLPTSVLMAIESRLRRLAGTRHTAHRALSENPDAVAYRTRAKRRRQAHGK